MKATDLSAQIWNALADLVERSKSPREIYYVKVTRADANRNLIWVKDFGDVAIPLVALTHAFSYYDTVETGVRVKREDKTHTNSSFLMEVVCPKAGDLVIVLDPWGAKRFPICIGVIKSKTGFWEGD